MEYTIVNRGFLCYHVGEEQHIVIGEITKEVNHKLEISWVFNIDQSSCLLLEEYGVSLRNNIFISGIDLDYGYKQRHSRLPFFIRMRVINAGRWDLPELLKAYEMEHYDEFELLLRNKGRSLDQWRVLRNLDDEVILNKDVYLSHKSLAADID